MKCRTLLLALATGAAATLLTAQEVTTKHQTTVQNPDGSKTVTITGEVVRYEPGQTIVIRQPNSQETTYTIGRDVTIPQDVQVGRRVTISTEPASDGSGPAVVTRVTTTSVDASGQVKTTTEKTETNAQGDSTKTETTTISGTVSSYEPGQFITITSPDQKVVKYTITKESQLPQEVAVGKTVTLRTYTWNGAPAVRQVTVTRTKTSTTKVQ
jgi:hypothetical protein